MTNSNLPPKSPRSLVKVKNKFCVFGNFYYYDLKHTLKAHSEKEAKKALNFIEKYKDKCYFVGFLQYEFYYYFKGHKSKEPYLFFYGFKKRKKFQTQNFDDFLLHFNQNLDFETYAKNFYKVKNALSVGQSYQINLSQELKFTSHLKPYSLFNALLSHQNTPFKAYIKTPFLTLLSFSPELFFKINKDKIITKPMKGTAPRAKNSIEDKQNKNFLKTDEKNLSENVMIVDLLRNDLSKLIQKNTMQTKLFQTHSYPTLHQMSSTIKGKLKKSTCLYSIFKALFPCGSITGAPKIETMKLIEKLEKRKRGVYCGSIGLIHKDKAKFSVAIRTAVLKNSTYHYGVGSGLVWQSELETEFEELKLKAQILERDFYLFETMLLSEGKVLFFKEHLKRILHSAKILGFKSQKFHKDFSDILCKKTNLDFFKEANFYTLNELIFSPKSPLFYPFEKGENGILRLKLFKNGHYEFKTLPLKDNKSHILFLSQIQLNSQNSLLHHKTSLRKIYNEKAFLWQENLCYDLAFFNEKNELCEASRNNIIVKIGDDFFTPSLKSGLLNGIYRDFLIKLNLIKEKKLFKSDILKAKELYCINSVRGMKRVFYEKNSTH